MMFDDFRNGGRPEPGTLIFCDNEQEVDYVMTVQYLEAALAKIAEETADPGAL